MIIINSNNYDNNRLGCYIFACYHRVSKDIILTLKSTLHDGRFRRHKDWREGVSGDRDFSVASALTNTWIGGWIWRGLQSRFPPRKNSIFFTAIKSRVTLAPLPLTLRGLGTPLCPPKWFRAFSLCSVGSCSQQPVTSPPPPALQLLWQSLSQKSFYSECLPKGLTLLPDCARDVLTATSNIW